MPSWPPYTSHTSVHLWWCHGLMHRCLHTPMYGGNDVTAIPLPLMASYRHASIPMPHASIPPCLHTSTNLGTLCWTEGLFFCGPSRDTYMLSYLQSLIVPVSFMPRCIRTHHRALMASIYLPHLCTPLVVSWSHASMPPYPHVWRQ